MAEQKTCPECGRPMIEKTGKNGPFLACSGYPECRHCESIKSTTTKTTTKKAAATTTKSDMPTDTETIVTEVKKTYDEVVAQFAEDYPEVIGDPATLQALASTVYIEKNKRLRKEKF